jgi:O-antigen/teichoic acid export membrane protein
VVIFFITRGYALRQFTVCRFKLCWDKPLLRQMGAFSGWTLCDSGAQLAVTQGRVFLLNIYTPLVTNAAMSIATQVSTAVYNFVVYFQSSFNPQITKASAQGNQRYLQDLVNQTSKFSYYMIFALTLPILLNMEFILGLWLKEVPQYTAVFCSITLLYYLVESLSGPLWVTTWAGGNIRSYQITVSLVRIITLPATWLLLKYNMEPWTVLAAWVIVNVFCYLYRLMYVRRHSGIPLAPYVREVIVPLVLITLLAIPLPLLAHYLLAGWKDLVITTLVSLLITGILIWLIGLKPTEKKHIKEFVKKRLP